MFPENTPVAFAYESVTVSTAAIGFTLATMNPGGAPSADRAVITLETAQIRFRYDGTDPTASEGHLLDTGNRLVLEGAENLNKFRAIRTSGTDGVLKVTFER